jgi:carbon storage regulator
MLVLSRQVDEAVMIGEHIVLSVTDIDSSIVRVVVSGRMLGGAEDGGNFKQAYEMSVGQSFPIGPMIRVTLVDTRSDTARFGINVPKHVLVHRKEIFDAIRRENGRKG